ncbi:MAG: ATP-binding cassette domain-containing protein, partial [Methanobrevibacter sp.]|nr:ATP-binding cassette domain-containing protein [Methanobrevibacter sp.]
MALVKFKDFSFKYQEKKILSNINLEVEEGDFLLFCGPSGSGKTTLLSNVKKELMDDGECDGEVTFDSVNIKDLDDKQSASDIGFLFQNPDNQLVTDTVIQEIAFPLENIGMKTEDIRNRVAEMTAFFGIDKLLYKNVNELSGGQKQLVNLCSLLVLKPKLLLLDEPTSQLDPIASYDFLTMLRRLNEEFSITIMISEHKTDNIFPFVDKVVFLEDGIIKYSNQTHDIIEKVMNDKLFNYYLPDVSKIIFLLHEKYHELKDDKIAISIREGIKALNKIDKLESYPKKEKSALDGTYPFFNNEELIVSKGIYFAYTKEYILLKDIYLSIKSGEFISIIGGNGTGKTTFLQLIAGLLKPLKGKISRKKGIKIAYLYQNPIIHFSKETVKEELLLDDEKDLNSDTINLIEFFNVSHLISQNPYDCSGGEQQKIAIIKMLIKKPDVLVLDEPTKGLDPISKSNLGDKLKVLQESGLTIIMTSHDLSFVANYCKRCVMIFDGGIHVDNNPKEIFADNNFYTTFVNRLIKDYIPDG